MYVYMNNPLCFNENCDLKRYISDLKFRIRESIQYDKNDEFWLQATCSEEINDC